jgi:hypothetical protein
MASTLTKLGTINNLGPGESTTKHWNNATPANAVWYIQGVPLASSFTSNNPVEQAVEVEVTRVWRKLIRSSLGSGEFPQPVLEHEVWYVFKNVGTRPVNFDVYASIIS